MVGARGHARHALTMQRLWAALLLVLCLAASQQGELLHELSHVARAAGAPQDAEHEPRDAGVGCDICLAFDHIVGVVATRVVLPPLLSTEEHWPLTERFAPRAADVPQARARAPPAAF